MIGIILNDKAYEQDIRELLMAFYPGESFVHEKRAEAFLSVVGQVSKDRRSYRMFLLAGGGQRFHAGELTPEERRELAAFDEPVPVTYDDRFDTKNKIKRRLYVLLAAHTGKTLPWGTLTGIRPVKIAMAKLAEGKSAQDIRNYLKETYFTSEEKISLCLEIAGRERELLQTVDYRSGYSLYAGIPFCPTTCLYCSFTSYPIGRWQGKTYQYLAALFREMEYAAEKMQDCRLDTVYFGGGTPTSLAAEELELLFTRLKNTFDFSRVREFTVEAGRPDSITAGKLAVLKKYGVTRISINPQTMQQKTLELIGRRHTPEDVKSCFALAREMGFDNINMDLIIGLPEETLADVKSTMDQIRELKPDSLTVHSLAIKRAAGLSAMKEVGREMIDLPAQYAREMGLEPYYLYRQKNMAGNFENVGYAAPGKACIYNMMMMEEQQTIVACGAGTTTKRLFPEENRLERAENVKDVQQYIDRIEEMIERKERLL